MSSEVAEAGNTQAPVGAAAAEAGKRASPVELYLDLVFALAIGQLAGLLVTTPKLSMAFTTLGFFLMLWWTWVGFAVLYNHADDSRPQRLLLLISSVPVAAAAVALHPAGRGHDTALIISLAVVRVILALARLNDDDEARTLSDVLRARTALAYCISAALLVISIWVPAPFRYVLWGIAVAQESAALFIDLGRLSSRPARDRGRRGSAPPISAEDIATAQAESALDADHFAERFGLFIIILLGELLLQAGEAAADAGTQTFSSWASLVAAAVLGGALWWSYFDATAEFDRRVLALSGGSPATARAIFAGGHMVPCFALLLTGSGVGLLAREHPPGIAYWLASVGVGIYLSATRAGVRAQTRRAHAAGFALVVVTYLLPALRHAVDTTVYLWVLAGWTAISAGLAAMLPVRSLASAVAPGGAASAGALRRSPGSGD